MNITKLFSLIGLLLASLLCIASPYQNMQTLKQEAQVYFAKNITQLPEEKVAIDIIRLNDQSKLPTCSSPLKWSETSASNDRYMKTALVECDAPVHWKLYITAKIQRYQNVLIAANTILKNQPITQHQLKYAMKETSSLRAGYFTQPNQLMNTVTARTISAGQIITPRMIKQNEMVKRGQQVTIVAHIENINVEIMGTAKEDGMLGDSIRVLNRSSGKEIYAKVIGNGTVSVS